MHVSYNCRFSRFTLSITLRFWHFRLYLSFYLYFFVTLLFSLTLFPSISISPSLSFSLTTHPPIFDKDMLLVLLLYTVGVLNAAPNRVNYNGEVEDPTEWGPTILPTIQPGRWSKQARFWVDRLTCLWEGVCRGSVSYRYPFVEELIRESFLVFF